MHPSRTCTTLLATMRPLFAASPSSLEVQGQAVQLLQMHRLKLGADAAGENLRPVAFDSGKTDRYSNAETVARIRGIERDHKRANSTGEDGGRLAMAAEILRGEEEIRNWHESFDGMAKRIDRAIRTGPDGRYAERRKLEAIAGGTILPVAAAGTAAIGLTGFSLSLLGLIILFEPLAMLAYHAKRDRFHESSTERVFEFLSSARKNPRRWLLDSTSYSLHRNLVQLMTNRQTGFNEMTNQIAHQDTLDREGFFRNRILRPVEYVRRALMNKDPSFVKDMFEIEKAAWVGMDRLLFFNEENGEPSMVIIARAATTRPRYPKTADASARLFVSPQAEAVNG